MLFSSGVVPCTVSVIAEPNDAAGWERGVSGVMLPFPLWMWAKWVCFLDYLLVSMLKESYILVAEEAKIFHMKYNQTF